MAELDALGLLLVAVCAEHEQLERVENHEQLLKRDRVPIELYKKSNINCEKGKLRVNKSFLIQYYFIHENTINTFVPTLHPFLQQTMPMTMVE